MVQIVETKHTHKINSRILNRLKLAKLSNEATASTKCLVADLSVHFQSLFLRTESIFHVKYKYFYSYIEIVCHYFSFFSWEPCRLFVSITPLTALEVPFALQLQPPACLDPLSHHLPRPELSPTFHSHQAVSSHLSKASCPTSHLSPCLDNSPPLFPLL